MVSISCVELSRIGLTNHPEWWTESASEFGAVHLLSLEDDIPR